MKYASTYHHHKQIHRSIFRIISTSAITFLVFNFGFVLPTHADLIRYKLNGTLVSGGNVDRDFAISPDSSRVVYLADQDIDGVEELYSVPIGGGDVTKLNFPLYSAYSLLFKSFQISPDSSWVVYCTRTSYSAPFELYSVPISGGVSTKLNDVLVADGDVDGTFAISPDSSRVVYLADQDTNAVEELYSVPIGGGEATKLNYSIVLYGDVDDKFAISPDSSRVIYLADQDTNGVNELYSVPITGGVVTKLNYPLVSGKNVTHFLISPDSSRVVYKADQGADEIFNLYSVPIGGGDFTKLNITNFIGSDVDNTFAISPDSSRVVYLADQDTDAVLELYSVPIGGGGITKLSTGGNVEDYFVVSPDSSWVVYLNISGTDELYSVPIEGGGSIKLNGTLVAGGDVYYENFLISPDSQRVVYLADQDSHWVLELYSVSIGGGDNIKLNSPLVDNGNVDYEFLQISPDSRQVIYVADQDTYDVRELYSVPIDGGSVTKLNDSLVLNGDVEDDYFAVSPNSRQIIYTADQDTDGVMELYGVFKTNIFLFMPSILSGSSEE